jgi:hypothetical protein
METTIIVAIISGAVTITFTVLARLSESRTQAKLEQAKIDQELREKKIPIYSNLLSSLTIMIREAIEKKEPSQKMDMTKEITNWASNDVFNCYFTLRAALIRKELQTQEIKQWMAHLINAIREDLGHGTLPMDDNYLEAMATLFYRDMEKTNTQQDTPAQG